MEHFRLHHGGGLHRGRHQDLFRVLPEALQGRQAGQTAQEERLRQDTPLHIRAIIQGMVQRSPDQ